MKNSCKNESNLCPAVVVRQYCGYIEWERHIHIKHLFWCYIMAITHIQLGLQLKSPMWILISLNRSGVLCLIVGWVFCLLACMYTWYTQECVCKLMWLSVKILGSPELFSVTVKVKGKLQVLYRWNIRTRNCAQTCSVSWTEIIGETVLQNSDMSYVCKCPL